MTLFLAATRSCCLSVSPQSLEKPEQEDELLCVVSAAPRGIEPFTAPLAPAQARLEQPGLAENVPIHGRGDLQRSLPTQPMPQFHNSIIPQLHNSIVPVMSLSPPTPHSHPGNEAFENPSGHRPPKTRGKELKSFLKTKPGILGLVTRKPKSKTESYQQT